MKEKKIDYFISQDDCNKAKLDELAKQYNIKKYETKTGDGYTIMQGKSMFSKITIRIFHRNVEIEE